LGEPAGSWLGGWAARVGWVGERWGMAIAGEERPGITDRVHEYEDVHEYEYEYECGRRLSGRRASKGVNTFVVKLGCP
jgi:hypothetical protein